MNLSSLKLALSERYQALGASDRRALLVLGSFFVLMILSLSIWAQLKATAAQTRMVNAKQTLLEIRELGSRLSQAAPSTDIESLKSSATRAGIALTVTPSSGANQISATHPSMATLSSWTAAQISAMAPFETLSLSQQGEQAVLSATLVSQTPSR